MKRDERSVVVTDTVRQWGSDGAFRRVLGVHRGGGVTRLYLVGLDTPLEVSSGTLLDVEREQQQ